MRIKLALAALLGVSAATAQPQGATPVTGWWRATLTHEGESRDIWFHIQDRGGKLIASFSTPEVGAHDVPLSRIEVTPHSVDFTSIGWSLRREPDGALAGTIPADLVPVYKLDARFTRSPPPPIPDAPKALRSAPKPVWEHRVGSPVYGGLAFDPSRKLLIVAADSGIVTALRADSGAMAWSTNAAAPIRARLLIAGSSLYVPTDKALLKLDAATGRRVWSASLGQPKSERLEIDDGKSRWDHYSSSAVVAGQAVYVGSRDGCVYRFNAASGSRLGRFCATDLITSTPVIDGQRLYFASFDQNVYAADIGRGKVLWKRDMGGAVPRDLALAGGNILAGSRSYDLTALNSDSGQPVWNRYYWFSWVDSPPNVVGNIVYIGASDALRVFAFDGASGGTVWESRVPGWTWAKPAVGRTTVYAAVAGTAGPYVGPRAGGFAAIDRQSGKLRWFMPSEKPDKAPVYGFASAPVVANGMVYAADLAGNIFAFKDRQ